MGNPIYLKYDLAKQLMGEPEGNLSYKPLYPVIGP